MKLRGVEFRNVWDASGVRGFFGEGYRHHHKWLKSFGLNFSGSTFVSKTTPYFPRAGNMELNSDWTPRHFLPDCIVVKPLKGVVLNSVGLSSPGAEALFVDGRWQARKLPFFLSFMSVAETAFERKRELGKYVKLLLAQLPFFKAKIGLQINFSCPNVGLEVAELIEEVENSLDMTSVLDIPIVPKFNVLLPVEAALRIANHPACDALCVSNSIPFGKLPEQINWANIFGSTVSPLAKYGGGGLSGKPLLPLVIDWVKRVKWSGISKPLNVGGGILSASDASRLIYEAGADSIFIGSAAILRPWRVRKIISFANSTYGWHEIGRLIAKGALGR